MYRADDAANFDGVQAWISFAQIDPLVYANLRAAQVSQHASLTGSNSSFAANAPSDVESRQIWPTSPRAVELMDGDGAVRLIAYDAGSARYCA